MHEHIGVLDARSAECILILRVARLGHEREQVPIRPKYTLFLRSLWFSRFVAQAFGGTISEVVGNFIAIPKADAQYVQIGVFAVKQMVLDGLFAFVGGDGGPIAQRTLGKSFVRNARPPTSKTNVPVRLNNQERILGRFVFSLSTNRLSMKPSAQ